MGGIFIITAAVCIDLFQGGMALSLSGVAFGGSAATAWIPFVGPAIAGSISIFGMILGEVVSVCISLVFGSFLITLMYFSGMGYGRMIIIGCFTELLPIVPGWSGLAVAAVRRKRKEDRAKDEEKVQPQPQKQYATV